MLAGPFIYTKTPVACDRLDQEIRACVDITVAMDSGCSTLGDQLTIAFRGDLTEDEKAALDALVTAHSGVPLVIPAIVATVRLDTTLDSDSSIVMRPKVTTAGWTMQDHYFEFGLGVLASTSLYSKKANGTNIGFVTYRHFELVSSVETLITGANALDQAYLTANAIRTDIIWEPTHDIDVISGEIRFETPITSDIRVWVVVVPDVPAIYGGSKELLTGGRNLRFVREKIPFFLEGRAVKHLTYSATYHTNKFQVVFRHGAGVTATFGMVIGIYRP